MQWICDDSGPRIAIWKTWWNSCSYPHTLSTTKATAEVNFRTLAQVSFFLIFHFASCMWSKIEYNMWKCIMAQCNCQTYTWASNFPCNFLILCHVTISKCRNIKCKIIYLGWKWPVLRNGHFGYSVWVAFWNRLGVKFPEPSFNNVLEEYRISLHIGAPAYISHINNLGPDIKDCWWLTSIINVSHISVAPLVLSSLFGLKNATYMQKIYGTIFWQIALNQHLWGFYFCSKFLHFGSFTEKVHQVQRSNINHK